MSEKPLRIELLGHVRVLDGDAAPLDLPSARRRALLGYLILHRHAALPRERVAYLFWPDSEEAQARTNLRRELHHLRAELPHADAVLEIGSATLKWSGSDSARVDLEEFEGLLRRAGEARTAGNAPAELRALVAAAAVYRGDLLPEVLEEWAEAERERLRAALLGCLSRLVELHEASGDLAAALAVAERVVRLEPLDESAYRALMRLNQRAGSRAAAIHAFHRVAGVLRRELGLEPSEATSRVYQELLAAGDDAVSPAVAAARESAPLVGRDDALASLRGAWAGACTGLAPPGPRAVVVYGEIGIGKTRLIEEFVRRVQRQAATVAQARAYAAEGPVSYGVALDWLRTPAVAEGITALPSAWRTELARLAPELVGAGETLGPAVDDVPAAWRRRRLLEAIANAVLAAPQPLLLIAEDLQWADADSLDALRLAMRLERNAQVLVVATVRTEELAGNVHLEELLASLRPGGRLSEREIGRLGPEDTGRLACGVAGERLAPDRLEHIYRLSEGVPLFVVEALRSDGAVAGSRREGDGEAVPDSFSPRVRAVLAAHLRQLTPPARRLAELAATVGRAFSFEVLRQASDQDEEALVRSLDELWRRRIVREQAAGEYDFSHDALRDAAYRGIDPARRRSLHRRVAQVLESLHARAPGSTSGRIAHHLEQGGDSDRAIDAYGHAAGEAAAVFSHREAARLLDRANALLARLPASADRDRRELELHLARAVPLRALGGHAAPALEDAMRRAQVLSERLGDRAGLFEALVNQQTTRFVSGRVSEALELSGTLQTLTREAPDWRAEVDHIMGGTLLNAGQLEGAITTFERSLQRSASAEGAARLSRAGADLAVFSAAWQAHALWLYGLSDRALASSDAAVRRAEELGHPYSGVVAHAYAAAFHHMRRDRAACLRHAGAAHDLCQRYGFAYYVHWGRLFAAWARSGSDRAARVTTVRDAIAAVDREGATTRKPFYLSVLAITLANAGEGAAARATLDEATELAQASDEAWWRPEIARLRALLEPDATSAIAGLREALACAGAMKARPLAARSAVSLALALRRVGRTEEARRSLGVALDAFPLWGHDRDRTRAQHLAARLTS